MSLLRPSMPLLLLLAALACCVPGALCVAPPRDFPLLDLPAAACAARMTDQQVVLTVAKADASIVKHHYDDVHVQSGGETDYSYASVRDAIVRIRPLASGQRLYMHLVASGEKNATYCFSDSFPAHNLCVGPDCPVVTTRVHVNTQSEVHYHVSMTSNQVDVAKYQYNPISYWFADTPILGEQWETISRQAAMLSEDIDGAALELYIAFALKDGALMMGEPNFASAYGTLRVESLRLEQTNPQRCGVGAEPAALPPLMMFSSLNVLWDMLAGLASWPPNAGHALIATGVLVFLACRSVVRSYKQRGVRVQVAPAPPGGVALVGLVRERWHIVEGAESTWQRRVLSVLQHPLLLQFAHVLYTRLLHIVAGAVIAAVLARFSLSEPATYVKI